MTIKRMSDEELGRALREHYVWVATDRIQAHEDEYVDAARDGYSVKTYYEKLTGETFDNAVDEGAGIVSIVAGDDIRYNDGEVSMRFLLTFSVAETLTRQSFQGNAAESVSVSWSFNRPVTVTMKHHEDDDPDFDFNPLAGPLMPTIESSDAAKV